MPEVIYRTPNNDPICFKHAVAMAQQDQWITSHTIEHESEIQCFLCKSEHGIHMNLSLVRPKENDGGS